MMKALLQRIVHRPISRSVRKHFLTENVDILMLLLMDWLDWKAVVEMDSSCSSAMRPVFLAALALLPVDQPAVDLSVWVSISKRMLLWMKLRGLSKVRGPWTFLHTHHADTMMM